MRKVILLSSRKDSDLVGLYYAIGAKDFNKLIKDALRSTIRGDVEAMRPQHNLPTMGVIPENVKIIRVQISLTSKNDEDIPTSVLMRK